MKKIIKNSVISLTLGASLIAPILMLDNKSNESFNDVITNDSRLIINDNDSNTIRANSSGTIDLKADDLIGYIISSDIYVSNIDDDISYSKYFEWDLDNMKLFWTSTNSDITFTLKNQKFEDNLIINDGLPIYAYINDNYGDIHNEEINLDIPRINEISGDAYTTMLISLVPTAASDIYENLFVSSSMTESNFVEGGIIKEELTSKSEDGVYTFKETGNWDSITFKNVKDGKYKLYSSFGDLNNAIIGYSNTNYNDVFHKVNRYFKPIETNINLEGFDNKEKSDIFYNGDELLYKKSKLKNSYALTDDEYFDIFERENGYVKNSSNTRETKYAFQRDLTDNVSLLQWNNNDYYGQFSKNVLTNTIKIPTQNIGKNQIAFIFKPKNEKLAKRIAQISSLSISRWILEYYLEEMLTPNLAELKATNYEFAEKSKIILKHMISLTIKESVTSDFDYPEFLITIEIDRSHNKGLYMQDKLNLNSTQYDNYSYYSNDFNDKAIALYSDALEDVIGEINWKIKQSIISETYDAANNEYFDIATLYDENGNEKESFLADSEIILVVMFSVTMLIFILVIILFIIRVLKENDQIKINKD